MPVGLLTLRCSPCVKERVSSSNTIRHLGVAIALVLVCLATPAAEPVTAILYGPSPEIQRHLIELATPVVYQHVKYRAPGEKRDRKLLTGISGSIENSEVSAILDSVRIHDWWKHRSDPWRLFIHGDKRYARITMAAPKADECNEPMIWYSFRDSGKWVVFDGPGTPSLPVPRICEFLVPPADDP